MSNIIHSLREIEGDGDSIYNSILDGHEPVPPNQSTNTVITIQPNSEGDIARRYPLPILLGGYNSTSQLLLPLYGLQLLTEIEELQIHQTIDLDDLYTSGEIASKYFVKSEFGDIIYGATEGSSPWQRILFGSSRRFIMRLFDRAKQESMFFIRRLAPSNPLFSCYLQRMDVFIPPCEFIGCIQQKWSPSSISLFIRNYVNENIYIVKGPLAQCCSAQREIQFEVYDLDKSQVSSVISHRWDENKGIYLLTTAYVGRLDSTKKGLILACAFLLARVRAWPGIKDRSYQMTTRSMHIILKSIKRLNKCRSTFTFMKIQLQSEGFVDKEVRGLTHSAMIIITINMYFPALVTL